MSGMIVGEDKKAFHLPDSFKSPGHSLFIDEKD